MRFGVVFFAIVCFVSVAFGQPGDRAPITISVVDGSGQPIQNASVKREGVGFIRNPFIREFRRIDGEGSTFEALVHCRSGGTFKVVVSAQGFHPVTKEYTIDRSVCGKVLSVGLEPNGEERPKYEKLAVLSGRVTNNFGQAFSYGFRIHASNNDEYFPKLDADGRYSIKLRPGDYLMEFTANNCAEYTIRYFPVGSEEKVLDIKAECRERQD